MKLEGPPSSPPPPPGPPRWRLLGLILLTAVAALLVIWLGPQLSRQHRMLRSLVTLLCLIPALWLWLLAFSRLPWRTRWRWLVGSLLVLGGLAACFRHRGFTGDMRPVFEWRWAPSRLLEAGTTQATGLPPLPGAAEFPQFLGPNRQGTLPGPALTAGWEKLPPRELWRHPVGTAWSGFAISGRRAITQEQRGEDECAVCYDLETGTAQWLWKSASRYTNQLAGEGPRATPTISGDSVFIQGATGVLACVDLATGAERWRQDVVAAGVIEGKCQVQEWGISASPCVEGDLVIVGGPERDEKARAAGTRCEAAAVLAFKKQSGELVWKAGRKGGAYSSPLVADLAGVRQVLYFGPSHLAGYALTDGAELWTHPWPGAHPHVAMPVLAGGDDVVISSGYGTGSARLRLHHDPAGAWRAEELWRTNRMKAKFSNPVLHDGHLYGLDDGVLACLDARTGDLRWRDGKYRHGQAILVGKWLLVMAEEGDVVLVDPAPEAWREIARFKALEGKTWNPPALAGEYLLVRNDVQAACFRLPVSSPSR